MQYFADIGNLEINREKVKDLRKGYSYENLDEFIGYRKIWNLLGNILSRDPVCLMKTIMEVEEAC